MGDKAQRGEHQAAFTIIAINRLLLHARRTHASGSSWMGPRWCDLNTSASLDAQFVYARSQSVISSAFCTCNQSRLLILEVMTTSERVHLSHSRYVRYCVGALKHNIFMVLTCIEVGCKMDALRLHTVYLVDAACKAKND